MSIFLNRYVLAAIFAAFLLGGIYLKGRFDEKSKCQTEQIKQDLEGVKTHEKQKRKVHKLATSDIDNELRRDWLR